MQKFGHPWSKDILLVLINSPWGTQFCTFKGTTGNPWLVFLQGFAYRPGVNVHCCKDLLLFFMFLPRAMHDCVENSRLKNVTYNSNSSLIFLLALLRFTRVRLLSLSRAHFLFLAVPTWVFAVFWQLHHDKPTCLQLSASFLPLATSPPLTLSWGRLESPIGVGQRILNLRSLHSPFNNSFNYLTQYETR